MRIDILTVVPELLESPLSHSIVKRAREKGLVEIKVINLRDFTTDKYKTVDDYAYGGGAGMVLKPEPFFECVEALKAQRQYDEIVFLAADGEVFTQKIATQLSLKKNIMLLCGHYKGVDQRVREALATREISIGDYVLTGGELAAAVVVDSVVRLIPGVLHDGESALSDSFQDGLLGCPQYTRPAEYRGMTIPDVLLSGNHQEIDRWRLEQREKRTKRLRGEDSSLYDKEKK